MTGSFNRQRRWIIHIIDDKKGIAVFEEKNGKEKPYYYLMIAAEKIRSVPLIVNNCKFNKQSELEFEQPDFERLIK
jgi:hypothetical protein